LAKEVETAKRRRRAQWQAIEKQGQPVFYRRKGSIFLRNNIFAAYLKKQHKEAT